MVENYTSMPTADEYQMAAPYDGDLAEVKGGYAGIAISIDSD
jgi:hypothetical protein